MHKIVLKDINSIELEIKPWNYGYSISTRNQCEYVKNSKGELFAFNHDLRHKILTVSDWKLSIADQNNFNIFINENEFKEIEIELDGSNLFPFGPEYGCNGVYKVKIIDHKPSGLLLSPWHHFNNELQLLCVDVPEEPTILPGINEGDLHISNAHNLQNPQIELLVETVKRQINQIDFGGALSTIKHGGKTVTSKILIEAHTHNASQLSYSLNNQCGNVFNVSLPENYYLFGREFPGNSFQCKLDISDITFTHISNRKWTTEILLHYVDTES